MGDDNPPKASASGSGPFGKGTTGLYVGQVYIGWTPTREITVWAAACPIRL